MSTDTTKYVISFLHTCHTTYAAYTKEPDKIISVDQIPINGDYATNLISFHKFLEDDVERYAPKMLKKWIDESPEDYPLNRIHSVISSDQAKGAFKEVLMELDPLTKMVDFVFVGDMYMPDADKTFYPQLIMEVLQEECNVIMMETAGVENRITILLD